MCVSVGWSASLLRTTLHDAMAPLGGEEEAPHTCSRQTSCPHIPPPPPTHLSAPNNATDRRQDPPKKSQRMCPSMNFPLSFLTSARLAVVGRLFSGGAPSLHDVPSLPVPEQLRQDWRRLLQPGGEDNQVNPADNSGFLQGMVSSYINPSRGSQPL